MNYDIIDIEDLLITELLVQDTQTILSAAEKLKPSHFLSPVNAILYRAIVEISEKGTAITDESLGIWIGRNAWDLKNLAGTRGYPRDPADLLSFIIWITGEMLKNSQQREQPCRIKKHIEEIQRDFEQRSPEQEMLSHSAFRDKNAPIFFDLTRIPKYQYQELKRTYKANYELRNGLTILDSELRREIDVVQNIIPHQSVNCIYGEEGSGKSLLAMNLAISLTAGSSRFLNYEIQSHGKILYLNNELPFSEFISRFQKMTSGLLPEEKDNLFNFIVPEHIPLLESYEPELQKICHVLKPVAIVIDSLYWAHNRQENSSSGMKYIMRLLTTLRDKNNCAVIVVHHTKKQSLYGKLHSRNMRGTGVIGAATDTMIELRRSEKDETKRILKATKLRYASDELRHPRLLSLSPDTLWFHDEGITNEQDHISRQSFNSAHQFDITQIFAHGEPMSRKHILDRCSEFGFPHRTIDRLLQTSCQEGKLIKQEHGMYLVNRLS